jgi:hypothetical protein
VREIQARRIAFEDRRQGSVPNAEIDVRRRSGRHHVRLTLDADTGGIPDEGHSFLVVEVAHVVRGVAGSVDNFEFARAERESFAAFEDAQIFSRDRKCFAKEKLQLIGPEALRAGQQFGRIGHVGRAILVNVDGKPGIFTNERAAGPCVIQVDVRKQDGVEIAHREAVCLKLLAKGFERRAWSWVDDGAVAVGFEKGRGNGARVTHPVVVESGDRVHRKRIVAQEIATGKTPLASHTKGARRNHRRKNTILVTLREFAYAGTLSASSRATIAAWPSAEFCPFTRLLGSEIMLGLNADFLPPMERPCMSKPSATEFAVLAIVLCGVALRAQERAATPVPPAAQQTESDEYTRYELLAPETASFKIFYEMTATTAGAKVYFNPIRKGSAASDEAVYDAMTGEPLRFEVVNGAEARKDPLMAGADPSGSYIKVQLARPVPPEGQGRILIVKTYKDAKSYSRDGDAIVFNRGLGIKRNSVVLPKGYELVGCNVPSQILSEPEGRITISFMNPGAAEAPLLLRARPGTQAGPSAAPHPLTQTRSWEAPFQGETERQRLSERAHQDRDIVYYLQQPETHAFSLYHDFTESRPGVDKYLNVVREGSTVSGPSAYILDTGEKLPTRLMTGAELAAAKIDAGESVGPEAQVVVIPFPPVKKGQSIRLRISETYTAPASYRLDGDELVFDRSLGRPRNAVVLPAGWYLTASAIPATVTQLLDGRIRLDFWNGRPDSIDVLLKAKRRVSSADKVR